ncbi:MAG: malate dehydrogenase [Candidatus Omnitrophota bacterium]
MSNKVTVVGAGFVGAACCQRIVEKDLADVILVDVVEGLPQGKALDIMESAPIEGFNSKVIGANDYSLTKNSDIVLITAGIARKPGMSRDDLQATNAAIISDVVKKASALSPDAVIIMVTNPLDVMSYLALKVSGFSKERVIGMAGVLDSARLRYFVSSLLSVSPQIVEAMVLGGHGDLMVPVSACTNVSGVAITQFISQDAIEAIIERTKKGGAEIVGLLKTSSAYYAPSSSAVQMVKSILNDEGKIFPCSVYLNGEYGITDAFCGVPVRLSRKGVEQVIEIKLTGQESALLKKSSGAVKENIKKLNLRNKS